MSVTGTENYWEGKRACAENYSKHRPPYQDTVVPWIIDFYRSCRPGDGAKIPLAIDVGCGPGQVTAVLSPHCTRVLAVDVCDDMLAMARRDRPRSNVDYRYGSALDLSELCADGQADLLVASASVHMFNTPQFYAEAKRVLKPDGVLALVAYVVKGFLHNGDQGLESAYADFVTSQMVMTKMWEEISALRYSHYKTLNPPFPVDLYKYDLVEFDASKEMMFGMLNSSSWIKDGPPAVNKFVESLPDAWPLKTTYEAFGVFIQMKE